MWRSWVPIPRCAPFRVMARWRGLGGGHSWGVSDRFGNCRQTMESHGGVRASLGQPGPSDTEPTCPTRVGAVILALSQRGRCYVHVHWLTLRSNGARPPENPEGSEHPRTCVDREAFSHKCSTTHHAQTRQPPTLHHPELVPRPLIRCTRVYWHRPFWASASAPTGQVRSDMFTPQSCLLLNPPLGGTGLLSPSSPY
jgi:hypothetical protein